MVVEVDGRALKFSNLIPKRLEENREKKFAGELKNEYQHEMCIVWLEW